MASGGQRSGGARLVYHFEDFESPTWEDSWTFVEHNIDTVATDAPRAFTPLAGKALRIKLVAGSSYGASLGRGSLMSPVRSPEEIYFRYYLRLGNGRNLTVAGGKMPGISGTYGVAGWGGRPSDGTTAGPLVGSYNKTILAPNPLEGQRRWASMFTTPTWRVPPVTCGSGSRTIVVTWPTTSGTAWSSTSG